MSAISFREARLSDAPALGALHVTCWRETYAGLLSSHQLDGLSAEARSDMWSAVLNDPAPLGQVTVFVAEREGQMVGFGACGGLRHEGLKKQGFVGEIGAIYVLRLHQRAGVGRSLMGLMAQRLLDQGRRAAALWVLSGNTSAREFYERLGGVLVGEGQQAGTKLTEVAYGWRDLSRLGSAALRRAGRTSCPSTPSN